MDDDQIEAELVAPEFNYTRADFLSGSAPYEEIEKEANAFLRGQKEERMEEYARSIGVKDFRKNLRNYRQVLKQAKMAIAPCGITSIPWQDKEYVTGERWDVDQLGIREKFSGRVVCTHPLFPVKQYKDIETSGVSVTIYASRGEGDKAMYISKTMPYEAAMEPKELTKQLARLGAGITPTNAKDLCDFINDMISNNWDKIPFIYSISRLGWARIAEGHDGPGQLVFVPYSNDVTIRDEEGFNSVLKAIRPHGSLETWTEEVGKCRRDSLEVRLLVAASFGSILLQHVDALPFFVHLWSPKSGTGKTVALMIAASIWGDPDQGSGLVRSFKSTSVGVEVFAGFMYSLPVIMDELQLAKDKNGKTTFNVYDLTEGQGKTRATRDVTARKVFAWRNCFLTSGETPLTDRSDGAGALNRVIDVECRGAVVKDGHRTSSILRENFGIAGREFVKRLIECDKPNEKDNNGDPMTLANVIKPNYGKNLKACIDLGIAEKQAMAASVILTADFYASMWIFHDDPQDSLTPERIAKFLRSNDEIDIGNRGYDIMCNWVAMNAIRFEAPTKGGGEVYGIIENGYAYINSNVWNEACEKNGINASALLSSLKSKGLILTKSSGKGCTVHKRYYGNDAYCVALKMRTEKFDDAPLDDDLPF